MTKAESVDKKGVNAMRIKIMRQIDELGRIVIPKDLRDQYGIKPGDQLFFDAYDNGILIHTENYRYRDEVEENNEAR